MIILAEPIVEYLFLSSTLLFIMGILSFFAITLLKIQGRPKLWVFTFLILLPLFYPIRVLFPDTIKVPVPQKVYQSFHPQTLNEIRSRLFDSKDISTNGKSGPYHDNNIIDKHEYAVGNKKSPVFQNPATGGILISILNWKLIAFILWGTSFVYFIVRVLKTIRNNARILKFAEPVHNPQILKLLHICAGETGLEQTPGLLVIDKIPSPMVMGFIKPYILLPKHLLMPELREGLRFTLLHELKHIRQRHNWLILLESIIVAAYFFHPVIHWAKRKIHEELELICDSHVVDITNKSTSYADFLLHEIWQRNSKNTPALALPFISGLSKTAKRIHSILENCRPTMFSRIRGKAAMVFILFSFMSFLALNTAPPPGNQGEMTGNSDSPSMDSTDNILFQSIAGEKENFHSKTFKTDATPSSDTHSVIPLKAPRPADNRITIITASADEPEPETGGRETEPALKEESANQPVTENKTSSTADTTFEIKDIQEAETKAGTPYSINEIRFDSAGKEISEPGEIEAHENTEIYEVNAAKTGLEKYLGPPVNELSVQRLIDIKPIDSRTVLFIMRGGNLYLTRLSEPCPGLLYANDFKLDSLAGKFTKFDRIHALSNGHVTATTGIMSEFYPYIYEGRTSEAIKLLKKGLLKELTAKGPIGNRHKKG